MPVNPKWLRRILMESIFCCSFHKRFLFVLRHPRSAAVNGGDAAGFGAQGASGIQP